MDEKIYLKTVGEFLKHKYVSPGKIQRVMQLPYLTASAILERMVAEGLATPRVGAKPCRVLHGRFKTIISLKYKLELWIKAKGHYKTNPKEYLK